MDPLKAGVAFLLLSHAALFLATHVPHWSYGGTATYLKIAQNLVTTGEYSIDGSAPTCYRPPVYPIFLAAGLTLFGKGYFYALPVVQLFLSVATGVLTAMVAIGFFGSRRAGGIAAALYGAHAFLILESFAQRETVLFTLLVVVSAYTIVNARAPTSRYLFLGLLSGLSYMVRPNGFFLLPAAALATLYESIRLRGIPLTRWLQGMLLCGLAFLFTAGPWIYYTSTRFGRVFPSASCLYGQAMYAGNNSLISLDVYPWIDWDAWTKYLWRPAASDPGEYLKREDWYLDRAVEYMWANPGKTLLMGATRLVALYSPIVTPLGGGRAVLVDGKLELVEYVPRSLASRLIVGGYMIAIYAGVLGYLRRKGRGPRPTLVVFTGALLLVLTLTSVTSVSETRFRLPLDPLLMIFASGCFDLLLSRGVKRRPALTLA